MKGGIEIRFELERGERAFHSWGLDVEDISASLMNYTLTTPRFMAMMVQPHTDIIDEYVAQWKSSEGLLYSIPSVRTRRYTGGNDSSVSIQQQVGVRSARKVYTIQQDNLIAESNEALGQSQQSISLCHRGNVTGWQYKVGSHEYPNREVKCDDESLECLEQLKLVSGSQHFRFSPGDWYSPAAGTGARNQFKVLADTVASDAKFWVMAADLSRDNGFDSNLTGVDLSIVPLDLTITRDAVWRTQTAFTGSVIYWMFVEHDSFLKLQVDQLSVFN
jgi:hypothetical protein